MSKSIPMLKNVYCPVILYSALIGRSINYCLLFPAQVRNKTSAAAAAVC